MTIVFYGARYMGMVVLTYLVAKGHKVKVIPEDSDILHVCEYFNLPIVTLEKMGRFDLFICCHGKKIIPAKYLKVDKFINIHPCLWKYKGHDPIKRYMKDKETNASVESHYMTAVADEGQVIASERFTTPIIKSYGEFYNLALPYYFRCIDNTLKYI